MSGPLQLKKAVDFDEINGEIRAFGRRFTMIDVVGLCRHLDSLVGEKIVSVIAATHARETGKDDLTNFRENNPSATLDETIEALRVSGVLGGYGVAKLTMSEDQATPILLQIRNPPIQASRGTCVRLILSYWEGALSNLLRKTLDITDVTYEVGKDILKCRFAVIGVPTNH